MKPTSAIDNLRTAMEGKLGDMKKDVIEGMERFKIDGERTQTLLEGIQAMVDKTNNKEDNKKDEEAKKTEKGQERPEKLHPR